MQSAFFKFLLFKRNRLLYTADSILNFYIMDSEPNNIQQVELDTELESLSPSILCFLGGPGAGARCWF